LTSRNYSVFAQPHAPLPFVRRIPRFRATKTVTALRELVVIDTHRGGRP
jgi:hypothetical protein